MDIDVAGLIGAVTRRVDEREHEGQMAHVLVAGRTYDTALDDLWDALTNPDRIPCWFLPISGELRIGGHYQLQGNAGGTIIGCEPPTRLAVTWEYGGGISWVNVQLTQLAGGDTRLELEHIAHVEGELWEQFGPGAVGIGWDLGLMGLAVYLATNTPADPAAVAAWSASADGKAFMRESNKGWCEAAIANGEDPAQAHGAAARTLAFYTGETLA